MQAQTGQLPSSVQAGAEVASEERPPTAVLPCPWDAGMVVLRPRGKKLSFRRLIKRTCTHSVTLDRLTSQKVRVPHRKFIAKVFVVRGGAGAGVS